MNGLVVKCLPMKTCLDEICALFEGPAWGPIPTDENWRTAETLVGRELPEDFKKIVSHTGGYPFGHGLRFLNPAVKKNDNIAFNRMALMKISVGWRGLASLRDFELFPEIGAYIPIGMIDLVLLLLRPTGDEIHIADFGDFDPPKNAGCSLSTLLWKCWTNREAFNGLGSHVWRTSRVMFLPHWRDCSQSAPE